MKNIVLIGAGQLGSRHLQALAKLKQPCNILVIDPSPESRALAEARYNEVVPPAATHTIRYAEALDAVDEPVSIAILAMGANHRFSAFQNLITKTTVDSVIFEKILFQDPDEYGIVQKMLDERKIASWVNCPLRVYPFFERTKHEFLNQHMPVNFHYDAGEWAGLACNSIHYLDLLHFFTDEYPIKLDFSGLDKALIPSKRPGFVEFTGQWSCEFSRGSKFSAMFRKNSQEPSVMHIRQGQLHIRIEELSGSWSFSRNGVEEVADSYDIPFQSDLTTEYVKSLFQSGNCKLTPYTESMKLHMPLVEGLLQFYNTVAPQKLNYLPVT